MFSLGMQFGFGFMAAVIIVNLLDDIYEWVKNHYEIQKKQKDEKAQ